MEVFGPKMAKLPTKDLAVCRLCEKTLPSSTKTTNHYRQKAINNKLAGCRYIMCRDIPLFWEVCRIMTEALPQYKIPSQTIV